MIFLMDPDGHSCASAIIDDAARLLIFASRADAERIRAKHCPEHEIVEADGRQAAHIPRALYLGEDGAGAKFRVLGPEAIPVLMCSGCGGIASDQGECGGCGEALSQEL